MQESRGEGSSTREEKTTFKFPQVVEDAVKHLGDMFESFSRLADVHIKLATRELEAKNQQAAVYEEVKKTQAAQLNALQGVDKRLKQVEQGQRSWRDSKSRQHHRSTSSPKVENASLPLVPTTSGTPQNANQEEVEVKSNSSAPKEADSQKFSNTSLKEQVQQLAARVVD